MCIYLSSFVDKLFNNLKCFKGFKYVPPANSDENYDSDEQSNCVPCSRDESNVHLGTRARIFFGGIFNPNPDPATQPPCTPCSQTEKLTNATGNYGNDMVQSIDQGYKVRRKPLKLIFLIYKSTKYRSYWLAVSD